MRSWIVGEELFPSDGVDVVICLIDRVCKMDNVMKASIGVVVIDECPLHCNDKGMNAILDFCPKYTIALSATPSRSRDGMFVLLEHVVGIRKIISDIKIEFEALQIKTKFTPVRGIGNKLWTGLVQSLMYNMERNKYIVELTKMLCADGHKIILLTTEVDHVLLLEAMMVDSGVTFDSFYGKKNTYNNAQVLVAVSKKASVGFDEEGKACIGYDGVRISCVILCVSIGNPEGIIQSAGRSWRSIKKKPLVVHIVDDDTILDKHWDKAVKAYAGPNYKASIRMCDMC